MNALQLIDTTIRAIRQRVFFYLAGITTIWACAVAVLIVVAPTEYDLVGTVCAAIRMVYMPPLVGTDIVPNGAVAFGMSVASCAVTLAVWLSIRRSTLTVTGLHAQISGIVLMTTGVVITR